MPQFQRIAIFSGNANPTLANDIAKHMKRPLGDIEVSQFRDGETHVEIKSDVRGTDVFLIQPTSPPVNQNLMELLVMVDAMRRASAGRITAIIPYYGYARQEKKSRRREPISAKLVANLLTEAGCNRILAMDLSAPAIEGFFDIPVDHLTAVPLLVRYIKKKRLEDPVIVAPDVGAVRRADRFRQIMGGIPLAILFKDRPEPDEVAIAGMVGDVKGKTAILVDDLISTGNTLIAAAEHLFANGAKRVLAVATHGVFAEGAIERLQASSIESLCITDTIPLPSNTSDIEHVSIAALLAEVINRIHFGISVSDLISDMMRSDFKGPR